MIRYTARIWWHQTASVPSVPQITLFMFAEIEETALNPSTDEIRNITMSENRTSENSEWVKRFSQGNSLKYFGNVLKFSLFEWLHTY